MCDCLESNFMSKPSSSVLCPELSKEIHKTSLNHFPDDMRLVPPLARQGAHLCRADRLLPLAEEAGRAELP